METNVNLQSLKNLAIAGLIGEGEFDILSKEPRFTVPFNIRKYNYLNNLIIDSNLSSFVDIEIKRGQFSIKSFPYLINLKKQWYKGNQKIFSNRLDPSLLTLESIIISLNLFGERKMQTISVRTTVEKNYIKTLTFCIEHFLNFPVIPSTNQFKVTNISQLALEGLNEISTLHTAEFMNFLTAKEKRLLAEKG